MLIFYSIPEVGEKRGEFQNDEYFIRDHYDSVFDALKLFSSDDLVHAPGRKHTHMYMYMYMYRYV